MKKFISIIIILTNLLVFASQGYTAQPKFNVHVLKNLAPGINYAINTPVVFDYDMDGDLDVLMLSKEGVMYFLENLQIP